MFCFVLFCFVSSFLNNSLALFSFILLHAAAAASVIDATPEEAASVPRRRRKLVTKKTGALDAQVASSKNGSSGGCPGGLTRDPSLDYKCSSDQIFCLGDECTANECRYPLDPCYLYPNEKACKAYHCYWYPHGNDDGVGGVGMCSSSTGVSCGNHHATGCDQCRFYDTVDHGKHYCHGDC